MFKGNSRGSVTVTEKAPSPMRGENAKVLTQNSSLPKIVEGLSNGSFQATRNTQSLECIEARRTLLSAEIFQSACGRLRGMYQIPD